jgi:hypothetical protein
MFVKLQVKHRPLDKVQHLRQHQQQRMRQPQQQKLVHHQQRLYLYPNQMQLVVCGSLTMMMMSNSKAPVQLEQLQLVLLQLRWRLLCLACQQCHQPQQQQRLWPCPAALPPHTSLLL